MPAMFPPITNIKEACDKNLKALVHQYIARFWYPSRLVIQPCEVKKFSRYD